MDSAPHDHNPYASWIGSSNPATRKPPWRGIWAVVAVLGLLVWNGFFRDGSSSSPTLFGRSEDAFSYEGVVTDFPTPSTEAQDTPIGHPPYVPANAGTYEFISTQSGGDRPVAYDPCRPIHVVTNNRAMPPGGDVLVDLALQDISEATGLRFIADGPSDEEPSDHRPPVDKERYGDRWAPVLISWSDPLVTHELEGDTAGIGGSQVMSKGSGDAVLVTGAVALDGPQFAEFMRRYDGNTIALAILRHELGHLVGLDHVSDPNELMYPATTGASTGFGPGDKTGLSLLGQGKCRPDL